MSGILRLESLTKGNTLKQGDKTPLKYRLFDADGEKLNIAGKSAQVRLVYPDFLTIGYEKDGLTVAQDDTVTFTIDGVIPSRIYHVEIIVDDKFIFPSRADESKFTVDKSSLGTEANIIEVVGVDKIVNTVLGRVDADINQAVTDINATNDAIQQAEQERAQGYQEIQQIIEDGALIAEPEDGSITTEKLADKAITPEKTTFIKKSPNIFNKDTIEVNKIISTSGELVPSGGYSTSDFIIVSENMDLIGNQSSNPVLMKRYDIDKNPIYSNSDIRENSASTLPNARFVRISIPNDLIDSYQLEVGTVRTPFMKFGEVVIEGLDIQIPEIEIPEIEIPDKSISTNKLADGSLTTEKFADDSVTPEKTDFLKPSTNLLDKSKLTSGYTIDASGQLVANASFGVGDFIKVTPNTNIYVKDLAKIVRYDISKNRINEYSTVSGTQVVPTSLAEYIRPVVSLDKYDTAQINKGDVALPYEPFYVKLDKSIDFDLKNNTVGGEVLKNDSISSGKLQNNSVTKEKVNFIEKSHNLFDKSSLQIGYTINAQNELVPNSLFAVSDFISVEKLTNYTGKYIAKIVRYDVNKIRINEASMGNNEMTVTTGNAQSIRAVVEVRYVEHAQFNKGDTLLPYEEFGDYLSSDIKVRASLDDGANEKDTKNLDLWEEDRYVIEGETRGGYTSEIIPSKILNEYPTSDSFIAKVDALASKHPDYITKTKVGEDSDGDLFRYDFIPKEVPTASTTNERLKVKMPKMVLISGIHGMERIGIYNLFEALTQIAENWKTNPLLETLRWNVHFIYMPVVSNYGYNNLSRKNENGIDLARNFSERFEENTAKPEDSTYGGTEPFSEAGSIAVRDILEENKDDTVYFGSFHNYGTFDHFIWNASATKLQVNLGKKLVSKMSRKWKKEYDWMPQDEVTYVGYADNNAPKGSESMYAASLGIQASTFETNHEMPFETSPQLYNSTALTLGTETIINWLVINLRENTKFYNSL